MKNIRDRYRVNKQFIVSPEFVESRKAHKNLDKIVKHFRIKFALYARMKRAKKQETIQKLAKEVLGNELKIQKLFNFVPNEGNFRFWEMPHCNCPVLDNKERWGLQCGYIYSADCTIHGNKE